MSTIEWYARNFGISDLDIAEADWVRDWVLRNRNRLRYDHIAFMWQWIE